MRPAARQKHAAGTAQVPNIPSMLAHLRLMPESEVRRKLLEMQQHRWRFVFKVPPEPCPCVHTACRRAAPLQQSVQLTGAVVCRTA